MRALATIAIPVVSFLVALVASSSLASSRTPGISTDISSANLKEISLPQSQRLAINNLIGAAFGPRVGLSDESYDHVRELAQTSAGPLLAIPGTSGVCLSLGDGAGCGQLSRDAPILAVLTPDPTGAFMIGGGITTADVRTVHIDSSAGRLSVPVQEGVFQVRETDRLGPDHQMAFVAG